MSYDLIRLHHENGKSSFSFGEFPERKIPFTFHLKPDNGLKMALYKFRLALRHLLRTNDHGYDLLAVEPCQFGHLAIPRLLIVVDGDRVEISVDVTAEYQVQKRALNRSITNQLVGLTLLTTDGNPLQTYARSSIKKAVTIGFFDITRFVNECDWLQSESTALWLYFQTITN